MKNLLSGGQWIAVISVLILAIAGLIIAFTEWNFPMWSIILLSLMGVFGIPATIYVVWHRVKK